MGFKYNPLAHVSARRGGEGLGHIFSPRPSGCRLFSQSPVYAEDALKVSDQLQMLPATLGIF